MRNRLEPIAQQSGFQHRADEKRCSKNHKQTNPLVGVAQANHVGARTGTRPRSARRNRMVAGNEWSFHKTSLRMIQMLAGWLSYAAIEGKSALAEAPRLNAHLNLLARIHPSDAILAADVRRSDIGYLE